MIYTAKQTETIELLIGVYQSIVQDNERKIESLEKSNEDLNLEISCLQRCLDEQSCV